MKVGITGHQDLGSNETIEWTKIALKDAVSNNTIDLGITCLARGADQMYAEVLLEHQTPYIAIIASKDYEETFKEPSSLKNYKRLLKSALEVKILEHDKASEQAFYDAGKMLVEIADFLIAVWDGKPARGLGGTADIVKYAIENKKQVIHINTTSYQVSKLVSAY